MNEITDKIYCLETISKKRIFITKEQADKIKQSLINGQDKYITVEGQFISVSSIDGIYTSEQIQLVDRKKQGDYQCQDGYWHSRGQECGHNLMKRYERV